MGIPTAIEKQYWSEFPGVYFTGDGALRDAEGNYRITGRVDDVLNVSGHRIGTAEVENAINMHTGVVESAVVGYPHEIKGQGIYAFVIFSGNKTDEAMIRKDIMATVARIIGLSAMTSGFSTTSDHAHNGAGAHVVKTGDADFSVL